MEIATKRLLLREFVWDDWPAVLAYQRDPRYLRYYEWTERSPEDVQAFVQMFLDQQAVQPRSRFQLAVTLNSNGRLIGNCGVRILSVEKAAGEIGYELDPVCWGLGYATEAARAVLAFGFRELGLQNISAVTVADNHGSIRVLEKLGMRLTAQQPAAQCYKGR